MTTQFTGDIIVHNNQLAVPGEKYTHSIYGGYLIAVSPMNVTLSNNYITLYNFGSYLSPSVSLMFFTTFCNMQDEIKQTALFVNNTVASDNLQSFDTTAIVL